MRGGCRLAGGKVSTGEETKISKRERIEETEMTERDLLAERHFPLEGETKISKGENRRDG